MLLAKIHKGQASTSYHSKKLKTITQELRDNTSLLRTSVYMLIHSDTYETECNEPSSDEEDESETDIEKPCSSNTLKEKNDQKSTNQPILISDEEILPSPKSLHLSTFLGTPDPHHIDQPLSQNTMTSISRLIHHQTLQTPASPDQNTSCDLENRSCRDPNCINGSYSSDEV